MRSSAAVLLATLALAGVASHAHAQSIGSLVGGILDYVVDGVDQRSFFGQSSRCQNRRPQPPRDLNARARNPTTVRLTWRARDNSCVDEYEITYVAEGMPLPRTFSPLRVKDYTVDIPGLQPNTPYVFTVRALNNRNGASSSAETRTTTPPQARCNGAPRPPMDVQTRSDSPTTLTVSWLAQANDPCVERYEVTYVAEAQTIAPRSLAPLYVTEKTVTLTNLQPDTTYNVVIAAVGTNGQRASVTTKGRTRPECSSSKAPLNTNARQVGPRAVQLTWNNPAPACVRNVQVTFVEKGSGSRGPVTNLGNKDNSFTFAQLQPGREYTFSVRYLYKDGKTGPASSAQLFLNNNSQGGVISVPGRR